MSKEKVCYTVAELKDFKELIESKIKTAEEDLSLLKAGWYQEL